MLPEELQLLNTKFHENPFSSSRVVTCGQTDGGTGTHNEAIARIFAKVFFAKPPKTTQALALSVFLT
jgi:hypothetical protein